MDAQRLPEQITRGLPRYVREALSKVDTIKNGTN